MKQFKLFSLIFVFVLAGILSACAPKAESQAPAQEVQPAQSTEQGAAVTEPDYAAGTQKMKDVLKDMQGAITAKDYERVKAGSEALEENWGLIEDTIKEKSKDLYDQVEVPLDMIQAAAKVSPLDEPTVSAEIIKLEQVLTDIIALK